MCALQCTGRFRCQNNFKSHGEHQVQNYVTTGTNPQFFLSLNILLAKRTNIVSHSPQFIFICFSILFHTSSTPALTASEWDRFREAYFDGSATSVVYFVESDDSSSSASTCTSSTSLASNVD